MGKEVQSIEISEDPQAHEAQHVHAVYDQIASHFSSTRYKPWPIIAAFLAAQPARALGLDAGTGNGKYLPLGRMLGLDRSANLLAIARHSGHPSGQEVVLGDVLDQPWRPGVFDYAISIATIHHLASHERRVLAVQRLLESVSPTHGRILIYVWAIEQDELSKRSVPVGMSTVTATGQDVFVPWVRSESRDSAAQPQVFNRYYHMFAQDEILVLVREAARSLGLLVTAPSIAETHGVEVVQHGWERSNHYVELRRWTK